MISYGPFWKTLSQRGITSYSLTANHRISRGTLDRMRKNEPLTTRTIDRLCDVLECGLNDIIEYTPNETTPS